MSTTSRTRHGKYTSATADGAVGSSGPAPAQAEETGGWLPFPTETEIYILPNGQVVFADLPAELADLVAQLGGVQPCAIEPDESPISNT